MEAAAEAAGAPGESGLVTADAFHVLRGQLGDDRGPRGGIQRIELVVDAVDGGLGLLVLLAQLIHHRVQHRSASREERHPT